MSSYGMGQIVWHRIGLGYFNCFVYNRRRTTQSSSFHTATPVFLCNEAPVPSDNAHGHVQRWRTIVLQGPRFGPKKMVVCVSRI